MRKSLLLGTVVALFGLATAVQASDRTLPSAGDGPRVTREAANDSRDERHDRYERSDRARERHDESREHRDESREGDDESNEHSDRR